MDFYLNGLDTAQFDVLRNIGTCINQQGFYLAGGTALAIYYGHRRSVDLDFFTRSTLGDPLLFAQFLREQGIAFVTDYTERGTLYGTVNNVRLSFLEYHYDLLQPVVPWEEGNCYLAALDDLICMKLAAIAQRGSRKDFIDAFILLQRHSSLPDALMLYQKKYQTENIVSALMGLVYFDDAESEPEPPLWTVEWDKVKSFLINQVRGFR